MMLRDTQGVSSVCWSNATLTVAEGLRRAQPRRARQGRGEEPARHRARRRGARLREVELALREAGAGRPGDRRVRRHRLGPRRGQDRGGRPVRRLLLHRHLGAGHGRRRGHRGVPRPVEDRGVVPRREGRDGRQAGLPLHRGPHQGALPRVLHRAARHAPHAGRRREADGVEAVGGGPCGRRCRTWSATASTPATGCSTTARTSPTRSGRPWASTSAAAWPQGAACGTSWRP